MDGNEQQTGDDRERIDGMFMACASCLAEGEELADCGSHLFGARIWRYVPSSRSGRCGSAEAARRATGCSGTSPLPCSGGKASPRRASRTVTGLRQDIALPGAVPQGRRGFRGVATRPLQAWARRVPQEYWRRLDVVMRHRLPSSPGRSRDCTATVVRLLAQVGGGKTRQNGSDQAHAIGADGGIDAGRGGRVGSPVSAGFWPS